MKDNQKKNIFEPSAMWQKMLNENYSELIESYEEDNFKKFNSFLNNFGQSKKYLGITYNILLPNFFNFFKNSYIKKIVIENQLKNWIFFNKKKSIKYLHTKPYGNLKGALINKSSYVTYTSFFNEIYGSMITDLIKDRKKPVISEIGSGYGEQAYFILLKLKKATYICFDIPEVLVLSSFFLMNSYPQKKSLLYGEEKNFPSLLKKYDLIFYPQQEIVKMKNNSVDMMINKYSLGEMSKITVKAYISKIEKITDYFFHVNQDFHYRNLKKKTKNLLASEYVPNKKKFNLLVRYLDMSHFIFDKFINYNMDTFFHIYKKKFTK